MRLSLRWEKNLLFCIAWRARGTRDAYRAGSRAKLSGYASSPMPMLQKLRDKTSGWIATLILGLLIIPFAFVGVNEYMGGGTDNAVAKVEAPPSWWNSAPGWWPLSMLWQR